MPSVRRAVLPGIVRDLRAARRQELALPQWYAAQAARIDLIPDLKGLSNGLMLDLGANVGDWTANVLRTFPAANVIAVEPAEAPRAELMRRFGNDARVRVESRAVAETSGVRQFHLTSHSHNASLLQPRQNMTALYGHGWDVDRVVDVQTVSVDDLARGRPVSVLKIDVQGVEAQVLEGAAATLSITQAVLLEVTFVSHYSGDATFPRLHELMQSHGFALAGLSEPFMSSQGTALWCDAAYRRSA